MPTKRPQFINGEIYHVIVRGIGGQKTFLEAVLLGQNGELYLEIIANNNSLVKDTIDGLWNGQVTYSRGVTLPY